MIRFSFILPYIVPKDYKAGGTKSGTRKGA
nr:MAG TPA: hypothetical protein [Caudoviricetes sp.]